MLSDWTDKITEKERISLNIANCKCCLLGLKDCKNCAFSFALPIIGAEKIEMPSAKLTPSHIIEFCSQSIEPEMMKIIYDDIFG